MIKLDFVEDGQVARLALDAGKGNVLSGAVIAAVEDAFRTLGDDRRVRAIVLAAEGKDFSFGASVPEHAPGEVEKMLPAFHGLFRTIARAAVPTVAAVRGRCLGGGFELVLAAHHIVASEDAVVGVPEVTLGVFPPVAAVLLPLRAGQATADRLVTLGETVAGREALALGLVDEVVERAEDVEPAALAWARKYRALSGSSVRFACRASRALWDAELEARLAALETLYLDGLMTTFDAVEGIQAFMARRPPKWADR